MSNNEFRVAIGTPTGLRSNVWKFIAGRDGSIYVTSRLSGDTKISLHASGQCQFSGTSAWVLKKEGRRNQDRHFFKWFQRRPLGGSAVDTIQLRFPHSELMRLDEHEDLSKVCWLPLPEVSNLVAIECYFTPPSSLDPASVSNLSFAHLKSFQLSDLSWFVCGNFEEPYDQHLVDFLRKQVSDAIEKEGLECVPNYRACVFLEGHPTCKAVMELGFAGESTAAAATV